VSGKARSLAADNAKPISGRPIHCSRRVLCDENSSHWGLWDRTERNVSSATDIACQLSRKYSRSNAGSGNCGSRCD
jgi:hypothetical protein